jgi:integrase
MTRGAGRRDQDKGAFGTVSQLPSGRWRAMHYGPEGSAGPRYKAPTVFLTKKAARDWLATIHGDIVRNKWLPPADQTPAPPKAVTLKSYSDSWLPNRMVDGRPLKDRTREHYRQLLDQHILPELGELPLADITSDRVREWYADTLTDKPSQRARAYSLLRTILTTAVTDDKLTANPCTIRGAGSAKRVITIEPATVPQLAKLVEVIDDRYKAMVLLAAWCALRFGELTELRRKDVFLAEEEDEGVIRVRRGVVYLRKGVGFKPTTTKSKAGVRDVNVPPHVVPALRAHLANYTKPDSEALLFPAHHGGHLHPETLARPYKKARAAAGRPDLRFHDLRHTGATLAAHTGASLAELMARLGTFDGGRGDALSARRGRLRQADRGGTVEIGH